MAQAPIHKCATGSYEWYRRLLVDHIIPDPYVHPKARHPEHLPNKGADQGSVGASHDKGDTASVPISAQTDALHIAHDKLTPHVSTASTNTDALHTAHDELIHHVSLASMGESSSVTNVLPAAPQASQMYGGSQSVPHLSSRSCAGATAVVITYPLDLIRARLAWASAGISEGHSAASASALAHQGSTPAAGAASGAGVGVARGGGGGVASSAGSGAVRPTSQATIRSVVSEVVQIEGAAGLYRGMAPTLLGILPYAGIKFSVYQSLNTWYQESTWGIADST
eukprot:gene9836-7721_t